MFQVRAIGHTHVDFPDGLDTVETREWKGPFYFIQAADCQFGLIDRYLKHLRAPKWDEEIRLSEKVVEAVNRMTPAPKFIVICGDLADGYPGTSTRREQVEDFKRIFGKLNIPLVCVCGNHDIGEEPTMHGLKEYWVDFGDDYYHFVTGGVLFIVINSQFYQHRANLDGYAKTQDEWLERILAKCKLFKYSVVFEHIPWFLRDPEEEDDYFNITRDVRTAWLDKFRDAGVNKIFCGHYHRNAGGWYGPLEQVVTSAIGAQLGEDESGVRIVKVLDDSIEHQYYAIDKIPEEINVL